MYERSSVFWDNIIPEKDFWKKTAFGPFVGSTTSPFPPPTPHRSQNVLLYMTFLALSSPRLSGRRLPILADARGWRQIDEGYDQWACRAFFLSSFSAFTYSLKLQFSLNTWYASCFPSNFWHVMLWKGEGWNFFNSSLKTTNFTQTLSLFALLQY